MKNDFCIDRCLFGLAVLTFIIFPAASCKKGYQSGAKNQGICVTRLVPLVTDYGVDAADLDTIIALFGANNLATANLQFQALNKSDNVSGIYSYNVEVENVYATLFFNGLPVFVNFQDFSFIDGKLQPSSLANGYSGPPPAGDTTGHQVFADLRNDFLAHVQESAVYGGTSNSTPYLPSADSFENVCLSVTLGYIDASRIRGDTISANSELVKVWMVTPSKSPAVRHYPAVYVRDDNGFAWGITYFLP